MRTIFIACLLSALTQPVVAQPSLPVTRYERTQGRETVTYREAMTAWQQLDRASANVQLRTMGSTDAGIPLHLVLVSSDGDFNPVNWRKQQRVALLINNGIHPGEPDGIDASLLLVKDLVAGKKKLPRNVVLAIIPVYNIGGSLNRSPFYRVDQNGPLEKGFRGNSRNYDLNRDFIKCDSREARSFAGIFQWVQPDIFMDNHVSNGADYQHVMTLLSSQHNKLGGPMGTFLNEVMEPALYNAMQQQGYDLIPYVNNFGDRPESGWSAYWDSPRYSSGYATLWHCFAFVPETHMLKPYPQRVDATYRLMESMITFATNHATTIKQYRRNQAEAWTAGKTVPLGFALNRERYTAFTFKGYEAGTKISEVSGLPRLYYDRSKPFEKQVRFYNFFTPNRQVTVPAAYIIPKGWWPVVELLRQNQVQMRALERDTMLEVEVYRIEDYKTVQRPFEGHYLHTDVKTGSSMQRIRFSKGDWFIPLNQAANRFLVEVLEPAAEDSYFAWNFFDAILGQKEGFSGYVFEETAAAYLKDHPGLRRELEERKAADTTFAKNGRAQLQFIYQRSPYYEPDHLRYPVYRLLP
ncbi:MAG TPA: M14 family metallopeptidase [Lacibacter sp.]|mgnify:CR=1 FL=1|nr:M14 family metallopeptidase [Lacibacter sp.]HMO89255.1 M14 family metallopeptidase [Lacibacter sp.]